jgi:hypothetical protein
LGQQKSGNPGHKHKDKVFLPGKTNSNRAGCAVSRVTRWGEFSPIWAIVYSRVAIFSFVQNTKALENEANDYKITKCPLNIPNGCKIFQMTRINYSIFHSKALQNIPN